MYKARIRNWRCIDDIEFDIKPITIFIGKNSTGKSSIVYAIYFYNKVMGRDPKQIAQNLYGVNLVDLVRISDGKRIFPMEIIVNDKPFKYDADGSIVIDTANLWEQTVLLPSNRIDILRSITRFSHIVRTQPQQAQNIQLLSFLLSAFNILSMITFPPPSPMFIEDYSSIVFGRKIAEKVMAASGEFLVSASFVSSIIEFTYIDPFTSLRIPLFVAPDGEVDSLLIRYLSDKTPHKSLIVIEEPENHKNPVALIDLLSRIYRETVKKNSTLLITTHNELVIHTLLGLVGKKEISHGDVAIYYTYRSSEEPWTRIKRLHVYEDGTIEELRDFEEATVRIF